MRSRLPLIAIITFVLGLELSTGFVEQSIRQYRAGVETFLNPNIQPDYLGMVGGTAMLLAGALGLLLWGWASLAIQEVAYSDLCPNCGSNTRRIRRQLNHRVLSALAGRTVNRRTCSRCSWKGLTYKA